MTGGPVGTAVVGAGVISDEYLRNLAAFTEVSVLAVADIDVARAQAVAAVHGVPFAGDLDAVLALEDVELVVNLTVPAAHLPVSLAALQAGKHVYSEKPLALGPAEAGRLLAEAAARGLRVGCAPDTILGASVQTAARVIAEGLIGTPVAATVDALSPGPEAWHPRPEFLFAQGAGPLFDIGPYYLAALVTLFGPVTRVAARARQGRAERVVGSGPRAGTAFPVAAPTHVSALLDLDRGPCAVATWSFESSARRAQIEILGTDGTLLIVDPTFPDGPVRLHTPASGDWNDLPLTGTTVGRGVGVVDMARSLRDGQPHRASGDLALHVIEVMTAITASSQRGVFEITA